MRCETGYIALGSNLENPMRQLQNAAAAISMLRLSRLDAGSSVYASKPMGPQDQPNYLNAVVKIQTQLSPQELLLELQAIECNQRRKRSVRWGPRTIDLDILLLGAHRLNGPTLTLPHPGMTQRDFVLVPLQEIQPNLTLPSGESLIDLIGQLESSDLQKIARSDEFLSACS